MSRWNESMVFLKVGGTHGPLTLTRHPLPKYLRFVIVGSDWSTLDALDQLDDAPREGETVLVARKAGEGSLHLDRRDKNGRRVGEWYRTADYELVADQPPQDVLRDTEKWREWATQQVANEKPRTEATT